IPVVRTAWHTILEHDARDAEGVEPGGNVFAFMVHGQPAIAAARSDHHGDTDVFLLGGSIDGERRPADVGETAASLVAGELLFADLAGLAGYFAGPDVKDQRLLRGLTSGCKKGGPGEHQADHRRSHVA